MTVEQAGRKMRVRVVLSVEVDPAEWCETYGTEPREVRPDVLSQIRNLVNEGSDGLLLVVGGTP